MFAALLLATPPKPLGSYTTNKPKPDDFRARSGNTRREKSNAAYRTILGDKKMTTAEIANARKISHMGCLSTLYDLEQRGIIERCGSRPKSGGRGMDQIVWRLCHG